MELTFDILIIFIFSFFIVANITVQMIECVLNVILVPRFGFRIIGASIFGCMFVRKKEQWKVSFLRLSPICQCHFGYDIRKPIPEDANKKEKQVTYLIRALVFLISLLIAFLFSDSIFKLVQGRMDALMDVYISVFAASFVAGILFFSVSHIGLCIYAFQISMKRMGGYTNEVLNKLRRGYSYEALHLKPMEELPFKNVTKAEKLVYYRIYVYYLVSVGQVEKLHRVSEEIAEMLETEQLMLTTADLYSWLVYYYSKYSINIHRADQFLKKVWPILSKDSDADAKRTLAQYYYRIQGDFEKARQYVKEGLACVDEFSVEGQRELERKLLENLAEELGMQNI